MVTRTSPAPRLFPVMEEARHSPQCFCSSVGTVHPKAWLLAWPRGRGPAEMVAPLCQQLHPRALLLSGMAGVTAAQGGTTAFPRSERSASLQLVQHPLPHPPLLGGLQQLPSSHSSPTPAPSFSLPCPITPPVPGLGTFSRGQNPCSYSPSITPDWICICAPSLSKKMAKPKGIGETLAAESDSVKNVFSS